MSIAGIRSNRGDGYQTLVAFDWALKVLSSEDHLWLEIDSVRYSVDDVVVEKSDGTVIACQCKKNQRDFKAWTIADLADELDKAAIFLGNNPTGEVRFYSRSNFGELAKLREYGTAHHGISSYQSHLPQNLIDTDRALSARLAIAAPCLSSHTFLCRTRFETSPEFESMLELLQERLRNLVSNPEKAFSALWTPLDLLGARISAVSSTTAPQHRLTKDDLKRVLDHAGVMLAPPMAVEEIRRSFSGTSAIGRSWRRGIGGEHIPNPVVSEALAAIHAKKRSILLTGLPGSGKTCVMLAVQDALEAQAQTCSDMAPLFIQSREFADLATSQDRQAQGLSEQWVEQAARMAENAHVVIVIDSLDVLSIARDHRVLTYFLAQIDRLLRLQNVTVITACRDFDRHYDRRIAERKWECELKCQPLSWDADIAPLLARLGIATQAIDAVTRELIRNPRELGLFVELAHREGSFNVVTSQALAQRYLDTIVRSEGALGDAAMQAIEAVATRMLESRSLMIPYQRFTGSSDTRRALCSLNVLQETEDGKLMFGHQTLLDVLVISHAIRGGLTLNEFIRGLSPVPFVRPSIRSFTAQLATGDRREFRKQIRSVLTSSLPFHIRRLVAESFAEQIPADEDWPLIRDLRNQFRDVFQVIYFSAQAVEWHYFWLKHLVPAMVATQDTEGLTGHAHLIARWCNADTAGVLSYWDKALSMDGLNVLEIAGQLGFHLSAIREENLLQVVPLLERLLTLPRPPHSFLGRIIARCVEAGVADDALLWRHIAGDISDDDLLGYSFENKLHCQPHDFFDKDDGFFRRRLVQSTVLLDLVLETIVRWSNYRAARYGETRTGYQYGFLGDTSYSDTHSQRDFRHKDRMKILFYAVEAAIIHHATTHSEWWKSKREDLCRCHEGALVYFAIRASTASPEANLDLIGHMLCDDKLLEFQFTYELGGLIEAAFISLDPAIQDAVTNGILTLWERELHAEKIPFWVQKTRAELISTIPCHQRHPKAQDMLDGYEKHAGPMIRQPDIASRGGIVRAPFSFHAFLSATDDGVLNLLAHYNGYSNWHGDRADFLIGGEREVGRQLHEAASRHPARFLNLLMIHWPWVPPVFRDDIVDGAATYLAYRYGNLQTSGAWQPVEEPDASVLSGQILDELERHPLYWHQRRAAGKALEACAHGINDTKNAARLIFLAIGFEGLEEGNPFKSDRIDLIGIGINLIKGDTADALMILTNNLLEHGKVFPDLLEPALRRYAQDDNPAIRALILRRLPYLQSQHFELGWELFHLAMADANGLWTIAEPCLYHAYHNHFEVVRPWLARLMATGEGPDLETWGRISSLATMAGHIELAKLLGNLKTLDSTAAWQGAASVWTNVKNIQQHRDQCLVGLATGLEAGSQHALVVAKEIDHLFTDESPVISIPKTLIERCFDAFHQDEEKPHHRLFGFHEWLNAAAQDDPEYALAATEIYLAYAKRYPPHIYDHNNSLTQLLTHLFGEAEEREESDGGAMLQRVVVVQDTLLSLGVTSMDDWLKAAERP